MTASTQDPEAEARAVRQREDVIKAQSKQHEEAWGKGPPFFSSASFEFWQQVAQGRFHIIRCSACDERYFPPRVICPGCLAADTGVLQATKAEGRIFSFTETHAVPTRVLPIAPVIMLAVDLDEGARVLTWLFGTPAADVRIGQRVRITVESVLERPIYVARRI